MKETTKLLCVLLTLVMLIGAIPASAKTKATEIDEYISASFDVYNIPIVASVIEFQEGIAEGTIKPAITDSTLGSTFYTIEAKRNGCLLIKGSSYDLYDESTTQRVKIADYVITNSSSTKIYKGASVIPLRKGDKISFTRHSDPEMKAYIAFIPEEKIFHIDQSVKNNNKTLSFTFGNVYGNNTILSVGAVKKHLTIKYLSSNFFETWWGGSLLSFDYTSVNENGDAVLTLPEAGEYTLFMSVTIDNKTLYNNTNAVNHVVAYNIVDFDTDKYINPTLDKLTAPISATKGTNIIVGYAEPYATVYVEYNDNKYSWKADHNGIYRIILDEDMKEGKTFKIWQKKGSLTSKKAKYRVTDLQ